MNKTIKIYIALLVVILLAILVIDYNRPKPIDWRPTYNVNDKIPFGLYVFDHESKKILKNDSIFKITKTPYEFLDSQFVPDTILGKYKITGTVMSIGKNIPIDAESWKEIFYFVSHGNTAFISATNFPQIFSDSLNVETDAYFDYVNKTYNGVFNPNLGTQKYQLEEDLNTSFFTSIDTMNTQVLGFLESDTTHVNFIRTKFRSGQFILHLQPAAFTNFHLLKNNHYQYAEKVVSYIPEGNLYWFLKSNPEEAISNSPLRYVLSQPSLKWAWYFSLIGIIIFMFFNAKRKQRVVPIISPLTNSTVDFTKTIGNLYYQEGDHDNIIEKKIIYFLEKIRNQYLIDTQKLDDDFVQKLHQKSGKSESDIQAVISLITQFRKKNHGSVESDLIKINNAIEKIIL
ncbi:DUF4350 domain-containing protein [Flavobacterium agrisoli]|uniref:DUF4350 domain-containing protein n=1 Tax=Flavobacterium agrisoli TaxID=2793066 RepID=A0A934PL04_9FLAO|nr:DUF4350 domain-containing protein [Flavobacterium agrisoli]MBK0368764.1 DUF4350 domain-containing protein [Flavobacterium agrisoli]